MDREATVEELRPPELAERVGDEPVDLAVDMKHSDWSVSDC